MVKIDELIEKYIEYSLNIHNTNDFLIKKKYIDKEDNILNKVYKNNYQDDFFNTLFNIKEPFVLFDIATDSLNRGYNVEKSYEIVMYLKENAYNLTFSSNEEINKKVQKEFYDSESKYNRFVDEYNMYKKFSDKQLYHDFHKYWSLLGKHYDWYAKNVFDENYYKPWDEEIKDLLNSIKERNELKEFFEVTSERLVIAEKTARVINAFYVWQYTNNKEWALKTFDEVLSLGNKYVTPKLANLIEEYKQVIAGTLKLEYKTILVKDEKELNKNMDYLPGLLDKYVEVTLNLYHSTSLTKRNKYIKQQKSIVDKVYKYNYQDEFFTCFFDNKDPFLLYSIALESLNREYDIEKSYEIAMYLKSNALKLTFTSDEDINKKAQQEFHDMDYGQFITKYEVYKNKNK